MLDRTPQAGHKVLDPINSRDSTAKRERERGVVKPLVSVTDRVIFNHHFYSTIQQLPTKERYFLCTYIGSCHVEPSHVKTNFTHNPQMFEMSRFSLCLSQPVGSVAFSSEPWPWPRAPPRCASASPSPRRRQWSARRRRRWWRERFGRLFGAFSGGGRFGDLGWFEVVQGGLGVVKSSLELHPSAINCPIQRRP